LINIVPEMQQSGFSKEKLKEIEANFVNPFLSAMYETLVSMGRTKSQRGTASLDRKGSFDSEVIIAIKVDGEISGLAVVLIDRETAMKMVSSFLLGVPVMEMDEMAQNAIREFALRTCEKAKRQLQERGYHSNVSHAVNFSEPLNLPRQLGFVSVPYTTDHGKLQVLFNITRTSRDS